MNEQPRISEHRQLRHDAALSEGEIQRQLYGRRRHAPEFASTDTLTQRRRASCRWYGNAAVPELDRMAWRKREAGRLVADQGYSNREAARKLGFRAHSHVWRYARTYRAVRFLDGLKRPPGPSCRWWTSVHCQSVASKEHLPIPESEYATLIQSLPQDGPLSMAAWTDWVIDLFRAGYLDSNEYNDEAWQKAWPTRSWQPGFVSQYAAGEQISHVASFDGDAAAW